MSNNRSRSRLVIIMNIPTPYRLDEFNQLALEAEARQIDFEVIFLALSERGRYWAFEPENLHFNFKISRHGQFYIRNVPFYLNLNVITYLLKNPPTWLCLGGGWYYPTNVLLSWLLRLRNKSWRFCFSEGSPDDLHLLPAERTLPLRRLVVRPYHGWIVSGSQATAYLAKTSLLHHRPAITFPLAVDEPLYRDRVADLRAHRAELREKYNLTPDERVFIWPARLVAIKNFIPFLEAVFPIPQKDYKILVAGDGELRTEIESWLQTHQFEQAVLLGHQSTEILLELYALADVFLFPSLSEPFGVVAIEAMWAQLPLLISQHVGAAPDVLEPGLNGWLVDPTSPESMRQGFERALQCSVSQLAQMGLQSIRIAQERMEIRGCIVRFLDDLITNFPSH